jgi:phosphatidylethanolamine-binding protein (PEBP) family uncharacterized protein
MAGSLLLSFLYMGRWEIKKWAAVSGLTLSAVAVGLALMGCGGSSSTVTETVTGSGPAQSSSTSTAAPTNTGTSALVRRTNARTGPVVTFGVSIPGLLSEHQIPKRYTCDGEDLSLPVQWSAIPHGTAELVTIVLNLLPVKGNLFFDWAVAGLSPTSHGITAGTLPPGAVVGLNSFGKVGYSICPPKGAHETYLVKVFALPHPLAAQSGFDPGTLLMNAERSAKYVGIGAGIYERP